MRDILLGLDLGFFDTVRIFLYLVPMFMLMIVPISCMLSVFLTFLRMNTDRELIALRAGGVSIYEMLAGPILFSTAGMLFALVISLHGISWGMINFRSAVLEYANTKARVVIQPGVFNQDIFGLTLFARKVDPATGKLYGVLFEDTFRSGSVIAQKATGANADGDAGEDAEAKNAEAIKDKKENPSASITILAPMGIIETDEEQGEIVFNLQNGRIYRMDDNKFSILNFEHYTIRLSLSTLFKSVDIGSLRIKDLGWSTLIRMNQDTDISERQHLRVKSEIQKRLALPVATLILGVFSVPLACAFQGVRRQLGIVLALIMFLVYYSLFSVGYSLSESGTIPAVIGLWAGNALFAVLAAYGVYLTARERAPSLGNLVVKLKGMFRKKSGKEAI